VSIPCSPIITQEGMVSLIKHSNALNLIGNSVGIVQKVPDVNYIPEELRNEVSLLQLVDQNIKRDIDDIKFDLKARDGSLQKEIRALQLEIIAYRNQKNKSLGVPIAPRVNTSANPTQLPPVV